MVQKTLKKSYTFTGKGLHTGAFSRVTISPAPEGTGINFKRQSDGFLMPALASNVSSTARSTKLTLGDFSVQTVEHVLSALYGVGVDNAVITVDGPEMPILDGSARPYTEAFLADGLQDQSAPRQYIDLKEEIYVSDEKSGSWIRITPADKPSFDLTIDFGSKVLGIQTASYDESVDYASQIAVCRTFVFFHEIEYLFANNLIKGGDVDNAIVVVEHPVTEEQVDNIAAKLGKEKISVNSDGYLTNLSLYFPNECGRHKLLDLIGDISLAGVRVNARITGYKPGHGINTRAAALILQATGK